MPLVIFLKLEGNEELLSIFGPSNEPKFLLHQTSHSILRLVVCACFWPYTVLIPLCTLTQ